MVAERGGYLSLQVHWENGLCTGEGGPRLIKTPKRQMDPCNIIIANVRAANPDLSGAELRVKLREAHAEYVRWILDTSK